MTTPEPPTDQREVEDDAPDMAASGTLKHVVLHHADSVEYTADEALQRGKQVSAGYDLERIADLLEDLHSRQHHSQLVEVVARLRYLSSFALDYPNLVARECWWHTQVRVSASTLRGMFSVDEETDV